MNFQNIFSVKELTQYTSTMLLQNTGLERCGKTITTHKWNIIKYRTEPRPCYVLNLQRKLFIVANNRIHIRSWPAKFRRVAGGCRGGGDGEGRGVETFRRFVTTAPNLPVWMFCVSHSLHRFPCFRRLCGRYVNIYLRISTT